VVRSEQIEARGRRDPEAYAVPSEGGTLPFRTSPELAPAKPALEQKER